MIRKDYIRSGNKEFGSIDPFNLPDWGYKKIWIEKGVISGIYFFINNDKIIYIGKSKNIRSRLNSHRLIIEYNKLTIRCYECRGEKRDRGEKYFIRKYNPILNISHNEVATKTVIPSDKTLDELVNNSFFYNDKGWYTKRVNSIG